MDERKVYEVYIPNLGRTVTIIAQSPEEAMMEAEDLNRATSDFIEWPTRSGVNVIGGGY